MGKTVYEKCQIILKGLKGKIGYIPLTTEIIKIGGSDERTIKSYLKTMTQTKLITDIGNAHFKINEIR